MRMMRAIFVLSMLLMGICCMAFSGGVINMLDMAIALALTATGALYSLPRTGWTE